MDYKRTEIPQEEIEKQKNIMARIRTISDDRAQPPLAFIATYGCQQNESDSEKLRGMLREMGYAFTQSENEADVIVINTCAIREHAEHRAMSNTGALKATKKTKPDNIIILCGCMVQQPGMAEKIKRSLPHVDIVFGPQTLWRFPEFLSSTLETRGRVFFTPDDNGAISEGLPVMRDGKIKALLSIMYGCNNFCSYCIVPYVRSRERSRSPEHILSEARELVASGYKDITLLGQNVNSYGRDLPDGINFASLIRMIDEIDGDFLIRFMTSHPKDASESLFRAMAESKKAAHHIHLPFQSGNDRILSAMNRNYTQTEYLSLIEMARAYMPDIVITSDVIIGFPGETEAEFEDTMVLLEKVRFDALFTFLYSKRPGTPAALLPDAFSKEEKQLRFARLVAFQNAISAEKHAAYVGKTMRVLIDGESGSADYPLSARTNGLRLVHLSGDPSCIGTFADAEITGSTTWSLFGQIADNR